MSTPDPFGDALAARAQGASNDDPYGAALAARAAGASIAEPEVEDPEAASVNALASGTEGLASTVTGGIGQLAGGLGYLGSLALGRGTEGAEKDRAGIASALTYSPRTEGGQTIASGAGEAASYLGQRGGAIAGEKVADVTGSPVLGAAVNTAYNIPQFLLGVSKPRGMGVALDAPETVLPIAADQAAREAVLRRVGVPEARVSALEGDASAGANDYQEAKLTNPNGLRMKQVIDNERQALSDHADKIVEGTGGTPGSAMDEATRTERGNNILKPLDDLKTHFDTQTKALYDEANKRAAGQPVTLSKFQNVLGDASELTNSDRVHLVGGVNAYLNKLKMAGEDGTVSGNVTNAETVRKYLNENWSPQNSKLVGKLKDAIDDDVTQSAGSDIYAQARAMRTLRGNTLDNPNGIAKLMDASGPNGINRVVPTEKVADAVTSMPVDQLNHVVNTLKNLPPELQESGNLALSEIKAHMAAKVADAGQGTSSMWNAKGVNQMLTKNSQRMQTLFEPKELENFKDLRDAGDILKKDQSYPGAAVQEHNLVQRGAMAAIRGGTTALGAHALGPTGAVIGEAIGGNLANRYSARAAMKNVESRIKPLD